VTTSRYKTIESPTGCLPSLLGDCRRCFEARCSYSIRNRQGSSCSSSPSLSWSDILRARPSLLIPSSAHDCNHQYSLFEGWLVPAEHATNATTLHRIISCHASRRHSATRPCLPSLCISESCQVNYFMVRLSTHHCNIIPSSCILSLPWLGGFPGFDS
jgi:hypothetical protein